MPQRNGKYDEQTQRDPQEKRPIPQRRRRHACRCAEKERREAKVKRDGRENVAVFCPEQPGPTGNQTKQNDKNNRDERVDDRRQ